MTSLINVGSFIETGSHTVTRNKNVFHYIDGTVEVCLNGETRRVTAVSYKGSISALELVGRYNTSSKEWPAIIRRTAEGDEIVQFGRDDRCTKFQKRDFIYFAN